jgi:hypothetical protein
MGTLAILAALSASVFAGARARARSVQCVSNLHQQGIALNLFLADHGEYPLFMNPGPRLFLSRWSGYLVTCLR